MLMVLLTWVVSKMIVTGTWIRLLNGFPRWMSVIRCATIINSLLYKIMGEVVQRNAGVATCMGMTRCMGKKTTP